MRVDVQRWTVEAGERVADQGCVDFRPITARQSGLAHPTSRPRSRAKLDDSRSSTPVRHRLPYVARIDSATWNQPNPPTMASLRTPQAARMLRAISQTPQLTARRFESTQQSASIVKARAPVSEPAPPAPSQGVGHNQPDYTARIDNATSCVYPPQAVFLCPVGVPS